MVGTTALPSPTSWPYPGSKRTPCGPTLKSLKRSVSQTGCTFPEPQLGLVRGCWECARPSRGVCLHRRPSCRGAHPMCTRLQTSYRQRPRRKMGRCKGTVLLMSMASNSPSETGTPSPQCRGKHATDPGNRFPQSPGYAHRHQHPRCK